MLNRMYGVLCTAKINCVSLVAAEVTYSMLQFCHLLADRSVTVAEQLQFYLHCKV